MFILRVLSLLDILFSNCLIRAENVIVNKTADYLLVVSHNQRVVYTMGVRK